MIYGVISDMHASLEALEAVLAELSAVERFLCLGDLVGYGPDPEACVERVRSLPGLVCIAGNHDLAAIGEFDLSWFNPYARAAAEWTAKQLSAGARQYLASLPRVERVRGAVLAHGALPDTMEYVTSCQEARLTFAEFDSPFCLIGHTHVAEVYRQREGSENCEQASLFSGGEVEAEAGLRYIVNCGSVGQPRDGNAKASYGIYDDEGQKVTVRRVEYPIGQVQEKMAKAGLPRSLIERLTAGR